MDKPNQENELNFQPLNQSNFNDFESLFKEKVACQGCWCMHCRLPAEEFEKNKGNGNRLAIKALVDSGKIPGVLVYNNKEAIGWCSFGDRSNFPSLSKPKDIEIVPDKNAWIISCLFIRQKWRRRGVKRALFEYLIDYSTQKGAQVLEGYTCNSNFSRYPDAFAFKGIIKAYKAVGFSEVENDKRPIMRYRL